MSSTLASSGRAASVVADLVELALAERPADKPNKKASGCATVASNLPWHDAPPLVSKPRRQLTPQNVVRFQADVAAAKTAANVKTDESV